MRKILIAVMAMVTMFWFTTPTHATLWDRGGGLIYDDHLNITWLQDTNYAGGTMTWANAVAWAENLNYYDSVRDVTWSDWRLPSALNQDGSGPNSGFNVTSSEMGHLYYTELGNIAGGPLTNTSPFINLNLQPYGYWSGTEYSSDPYAAWGFGFDVGVQGIGDTGDLYAWAVRDGDIRTPVPEPSTMLLLGSGLLGLWRFRKKFRK